VLDGVLADERVLDAETGEILVDAVDDEDEVSENDLLAENDAECE
jgi:hypothetical protein